MDRNNAENEIANGFGADVPHAGSTIDAVKCTVNNCHYNQNKHCIAGEILVGPHFAASSADTICATFQRRA